MPTSPLDATAASPVKPEPRGCTNFLLHQLVRRMDRLYDAELAKAGLRTSQYSLLSHVVRLGPVRPGVLAQAMKMQPSTLTRNLRPLVLAGWVDVGGGHDARSRSVTATDTGRVKHLQAQRHWKRVQQRVNGLLGADSVVLLHQQLAHVMDAIAADATSGEA